MSQIAHMRQIEAITRHASSGWLAAVLWTGLLLSSWAYSLDGLTHNIYQARAAASFDSHSSLATLNIIGSIVQSMAQFPMASLADRLGRFQALVCSLVFYSLGGILAASSSSVAAFACGAAIYQFGFAGLVIVLLLIVSDATSLRNRTLGQILLSSPFLINTFISGNVTSFVFRYATWRIGIAMWAVLVPLFVSSVLLVLLISHWKAKDEQEANGSPEALDSPDRRKKLRSIANEMDAMGLFLLVASLALLLIPLQLAADGQHKHWRNPYIILMLLTGGASFAGFLFHESHHATHPVFPARLFKSRTVLGALGIAFFAYLANYMYVDFYYTVAKVAFGQSDMAATRIASLYGFAGTVSGISCGLFLRCYPKVKPVALAGVVLWLTGYGLMLRFKGVNTTQGQLITSQLLIGTAAGFLLWPAQTAIQSAVPLEHVSVATSLYLCFFNMGAAISAAIAGAIWRTILPIKLSHLMGNAGLAEAAYRDPFSFLAKHPWGTPEQIALGNAQASTQLVLVTVGFAFSVPLLLAVLLMGPIDFTDCDAEDTTEAEGEPLLAS